MNKFDLNKYMILETIRLPFKVTYVISDENAVRLLWVVKNSFLGLKYSFYESESFQTPIMTIRSTRRFYHRKYVVEDASESKIGTVAQKDAWLLLNYFGIYNNSNELIGKIKPKTSITNIWSVYSLDNVIGSFQQKSLGSVENLLDLSEDASRQIDRRLVLAAVFVGCYSISGTF